MIELRHLEYFLSVLDTGSFTKAAQISHVAQSGISQQIARLEAQLGVVLFRRSSRQVEPTQAAKVLAPHARAAIASVQRGIEEVDALVGLRRGRLKVGLLQTPSSSLDIVSLLAKFHVQFPDIELDVINDTSVRMAEAVRDRRLDIAVVGLSAEQLPPELDSEELTAEPLVAVVPGSSPFADESSITLSRLFTEHEFIKFGEGTGLRMHTDSLLERAGVTPKVAMELSLISDLVDVAIAGAGATIVPATAARLARSRVGADFAALPIDDETAVSEVRIACHPAHLSPSAKVFRDWVISYCPSERPTAAEILQG